MFLFVAFSFT